MGMTQYTTQTQNPGQAGREIAEGDRIYAVETIGYLEITDPRLNDGVIMIGDEGTVIELTGHDDYDLFIEWDRGFQGTASSADVALV